MPDMVKTLSQIFSNPIFRVPDYQRGYAWEDKQWDDLELLPEGRNHFTGTLVLRARENGSRKSIDIRGNAYFLLEYEYYLAGGRHVETSWEVLQGKPKDQSIEHVLPQDPQDSYWKQRFKPKQRERWTHDIGNLALTYDNSSLGNRPFLEKKGKPGQVGHYAGSPLFIEHELAGYRDWTIAQIQERREAIRAWAIQRWAVEPPLATTVDGLPDEFTSERILALANQFGVEEELRLILDAIQPFGLYPMPKKWCVVVAPPHNHNLALGAIWPKLGCLLVGIWHDRWPKYFNFAEDEVARHLGDETWQYLDSSNVDEFVANLKMLLSREDGQAGGIST